ncbi:hypothetical protein MASR2M15_04910 [Anaerolineales bacterium]
MEFTLAKFRPVFIFGNRRLHKLANRAVFGASGFRVYLIYMMDDKEKVYED